MSEVSALICLLDDPDSFVNEAVRNRLYELRETSLTEMREFVVYNNSNEIKILVEELLFEFGFKKFKEEMMNIINNNIDNDFDLEQTLLIISYIGYPDLNPNSVSQQVDTMSDIISSKLKDRKNGSKVISIINSYLFDNLGFLPVQPDQYYNPENSFINYVIENRTGLPVTLCCIYLLISERLNLKLGGIGFPGHFMLKYNGEFNTSFYIDPYNGGLLYSKEYCIKLLSDMGIESNEREELLEPISNKLITVRILRNLILIYQKIKPLYAKDLESIINLISKK